MFINTSSAFIQNQPISISVLVTCGIGENSFGIFGGIVSGHNWNWSYYDDSEFGINMYSVTTPYVVNFTLNPSNQSSGNYHIWVMIGSNSLSYWNFTVYGDNDVDGISDQFDNCIQIANANQADIDNDGVGDSCDDDIDGDGISNENDDLPNNTNESMDTDGDGIGNNVDTDDDGDGMADSDDAFPLNPTEQADLDGDGVGDNLDADDDADGVTDVTDNCPLIANSDQADLDGDGIGSECDGVELTVDENGTISGDGNAIPSIGMVGTAVAISAGFFIAIRREDEE